MARERIPVDISNDPAVLRLAEKARASEATFVLQADSEDVAELSGIRTRRKRASGRPVTNDDALFRLVGIGRSGIPGGVSGKKHEAIRRAKRPQ